MINLVLYQPDIPQNTGSFIRLAACMNVNLHIIEPCGFPINDKQLQRVAMDYSSQVIITRHTSWETFVKTHKEKNWGRLILFTTKADSSYTELAYKDDDMLLFGRESSGAPQHVHDAVGARLVVPMHSASRSLNIVQTASMVLGEALRQTKQFPE